MMDDASVLTIDPRRAFGRVCVNGTRIPAETVAEAVFAGDGVADVAAGYGITAEAVLMSCWWLVESSRPVRFRGQAKRVVDRWGTWADEALLVLGGHNPGPCPEPPS